MASPKFEKIINNWSQNNDKGSHWAHDVVIKQVLEESHVFVQLYNSHIR